MQVIRHDGIETDLKKLKRSAAPRESLESWERFFAFKGIKETPGVNQFPGFGDKKIYKARVVPLRENFGKSKGYRVIFQILDGDICKILVFSRHGIYHDEKDLIGTIRKRLES